MSAPTAEWQTAGQPFPCYAVNPMDTKICVKCKQEKSVLDFHKNSRSSDGLHSYCKECNKAQALAHIRAEKARKALLRAARKAATTTSNR
jgi:ribosomal protein L40E